MAKFRPKFENLDDEDDYPEILVEKKSFNAEDIRTSISLLVTDEYNILLTAVGTLSRCAAKDEELLTKFVIFGIYPKLLDLLQRKDDVILKYTLKLLAMLAKPRILRRLEYEKIFICAEMVTRIFVKMGQDFIQECASFILWQLVKYNDVVATQIYSCQLIGAIFKNLSRVQDVDVLWNSLNLFKHLLDVEVAKEDIHRNGFFSGKVSKCLLECEQEGVKGITLDIILKLSDWRMPEMSVVLTKEGFLSSMVDMLLKDDIDCIESAFNVIQNCVSHEECAVEFSKCLHFREFILWLASCPNKCILLALPMLDILSKVPSVRQKLYDLCFEQIIYQWMKYQHSQVILDLLKIINNMSEHRRCCKDLCKFAIIKAILGHITNPKLPIQPYGEQALVTLKNLLVRAPKSLDFFVAAKGVSVISELFLDEEEHFTKEGFKSVIAILQILLTSQFCESVLSEFIFDQIFNLYEVDDYRIDMLKFMDILSKHEEFRNYMLLSEKIEELFAGLKKDKTTFGTGYHLNILSNLAEYKEIGYKLLDLECLPFLQDVNRKLDLSVIKDIIDQLYNYCLTLKFYDTGRLDVSNRLDDRFYLIQEKVSPESLALQEFNRCSKPVYVVSVRLFKFVSEADKSRANITGFANVGISSTDVQQGKRAISTTASMNQANLTLKAVYQHGEIPENMLYYRRASFYSGEKSFYQDYYLERYILTLMRDLYFSDDAPCTLSARIETVAKYVARQLSGIYPNVKESEESLVFEEHIRSLQENAGMNVIPIGYLRMGKYCERALLFKVLCDNLCIPTTLDRGLNDIYWNEVRCSDDSDGECGVGNNRNRLYIVDLMKEVGTLIPMNSLDAEEYLNPPRETGNKNVNQ